MHTGSCHCGAVRYTVEGTPDQAIECNCSHCERKGMLLWFAPREALTITEGADKLATYTFNRHAIQHQFCPSCGVQPFAYGKDKEGAEIAAINLRCLDGNHVESIRRVPFNGRDL